MARASAALAKRRLAQAVAKRPSPLVIDNDIKRAREDFYSFAAMMGKPPAEHMLPWIEKLNTGKTTRCLMGIGGDDTVILSPRGSAKSTVLILWVSWALGNHTLERWFLRVLYVSFIIDISRAKSASIKGVLASPEYKRVFPTVRISDKRYADELWSIDFDYAGINVTGDDAYTICCSGLKGATVSRRSNLVVLDDLIKSVESILNPAVRKQMITNYTTAIMPTRLDGARTIALGTRFLYDDIFNTLFTPANGFNLLSQKALLTDPVTGDIRSYWPEFFSLEDLLRKRSLGPLDFAYQYQNETPATGDLGTDATWLNYGPPPDCFDVIGVSIDLSSADKETNDWSVILLGGRDGDAYWFLDFRRLRTLGNVEKIEALKDMLADWDIIERQQDGTYRGGEVPCSIWPESVAYQRSFAGDLSIDLRNDAAPLDNLNVQEVKGFRGDKIERFKGIIGLFQRGRVHLNRYRDWSVFEQEFLNLGATSFDDFIDAATILLTRLSRRRPIDIETSRSPGELPPAAEDSWASVRGARAAGES